MLTNLNALILLYYLHREVHPGSCTVHVTEEMLFGLQTSLLTPTVLYAGMVTMDFGIKMFGLEAYI